MPTRGPSPPHTLRLPQPRPAAPSIIAAPPNSPKSSASIRDICGSPNPLPFRKSSVPIREIRGSKPYSHSRSIADPTTAPPLAPCPPIPAPPPPCPNGTPYTQSTALGTPPPQPPAFCRNAVYEPGATLWERTGTFPERHPGQPQAISSYLKSQISNLKSPLPPSPTFPTTRLRLTLVTPKSPRSRIAPFPSPMPPQTPNPSTTSFLEA